MGTGDLAERVRELEARLRQVEDALAIQRMKARYGQLVDARYTKAGPKPREALEPIAREIASLFTEDAVWDGGPGLGVCRGREAIYERFLAPTLRFSWHFFLKPNLEVTGDTARGTWDILAPCTTTTGRAMWMTGVEHDEYARGAHGWVHTSMRLELVFLSPYDRGWAPSE
jgi:hypothetical protein